MAAPSRSRRRGNCSPEDIGSPGSWRYEVGAGTGFNGDIAQWSSEATRTASEYVRVYKEIRRQLVERLSFPLPQPRTDEDWDAVLFGDALLFAFRMEGPDSVAICASKSAWEQRLGSDQAQLKWHGGRLNLKLPRYASALWQATAR